MQHHLKKILVATTLDDTSDKVVRAGKALADAAGAELHLLHAYFMPAMYYGTPMGSAVVYPYTIEDERKRVEQRLTAQLKRVDISRREVQGEVLEIGNPHRLLVAAAEEIGADLILVGASEVHGPFAPLLGSTADRVLRISHVPVLVVRDDIALPLIRVLAPTDLSELSEESLRHGMELLAGLGAERPAFETFFVLSNIERVGSVQFTPDQVERFAREELERHTQALSEDSGWEVESSMRVGLPRREILDRLQANAADLVLVGTHGRSGFERLLMGSVAADVVRHSKMNVLVVPPEEASEGAAESHPERNSHAA